MPGLPGGRLARLSRYFARATLVLARAAWCDDRALGDGCSWGHGWSFRITRRVQLVGLIVEHLTSSRCAAVDVGFFVSQSVSLCSVACGLMKHQCASSSGCAGSTERLVFEWRGAWQGLPWLLGQRPVSVAWFGTRLRVSVRECERPFRTYVPYVRSRDDLK